jgi:DNA (cytosine-5)-methyltransferase 1
MTKLNTIDLFAGCGGFTEGFKSSGLYNLIAAVEWDKDAITSLRNRLTEKWSYIDSHQIALHFDIQRTNELLNGYNDPIYGKSEGLIKIVSDKNVDLVIGGPPCQAYSMAGRISDKNGMHDDYRNYLFESYLKVVDEFKPRACIFENVPGMLSASPNGIPIRNRIKEAFNNSGYTILEDLKDAVFDLSNFGVPQKRKRVIVLALRNEIFKSPENQLTTFYDQLKTFKAGPVTVEQKLSKYPELYPLVNHTKRISHKQQDRRDDISDHDPRFHNQRDIGIFKLLAEDIEKKEYKYLNSDTLKELYTLKTGKSSNVHKYHVLRRDKPSNTIPAHLNKDGLRHIHYDSKQARTISVREAAALQSFDDDFKFFGSMGSKYKMIGNAVPPQFSEIIAKYLKQILI